MSLQHRYSTEIPINANHHISIDDINAILPEMAWNIAVHDHDLSHDDPVTQHGLAFDMTWPQGCEPKLSG